MEGNESRSAAVEAGHKAMPIGATFTLYSWAQDMGANGCPLRGIASRRVKTENGSRLLRDRYLSTTFAPNRKGTAEAERWSSVNSVRSWDRNARVQS